MFADLVDRISLDNPKAIAIDLSFIGESEIPLDDIIFSEFDGFT